MEKEEQKENQAKKGWLSKIGNLVFEGSDEKVDSDSESKIVDSNYASKFHYSEVTQGSNISAGIPANMTIQTSNGMFDEKFYNSFLKIIEDNDVEGMDYFEFSKIKRNLEANGTPSPASYQSAFGALQAASKTPVTKQVLLETADFYIGKLLLEETSFNSEMQNEIDGQVNSRISQATIKQNEIISKQEQILKLQSDIASFQTEISTLNSEAQQTQFKIESTAKNFKVSFDVLVKQIEADKENIKNCIK